MKKIIIMGGGVAGLSAAWKLSEAGYEVELIEIESEVGGLCRSIQRNDFTFDLGGHRFITADEEVLKEIKGLMGNSMVERDRRSVIHLNGKYFEYPLKMNDLLIKMNPIVSLQSFIDYMRVKLKGLKTESPDLTLKDWVINRYGKKLYEIYFGPYSEKLWGRPSEAISSDWSAQRISLLSFTDVLVKMFTKGSRVPRTYAPVFYYPRKGIAQIPEYMAKRVEANGGNIILNARVSRVIISGNRVKGIEIEDEKGDKRVLKADFFISTIPITDLIKVMGPLPDKTILSVVDTMQFRGLRLLNLMIDQERITDNTWIYIPTSEYLFMRIQEPKNWLPENAPPLKTSLILEVPCSPGDEIWQSHSREFKHMCIGGLEKMNLFDTRCIYDSFDCRIKYAYPIYDLEYRKKLKAVLGFIDNIPNIISIGRQGLFRYNNMDHSIKMGFMAARHITSGLAKDEIYSVATEQSYFENQ